MTGRNPWAVLRVAEGAPYLEIQRAYRRRVKQTHPDSGGDAVDFATVVEAFEAVRYLATVGKSPVRSRPTPYDSWTRPFRPVRSWSEDDLGTHQFSADDATILHLPGSDFTSVLENEMAKALATA